MFGRISFYKTHNDVRNAIQKRETETNIVQNQLTTGNRLHRLSDDPSAASHATRYASMLVRKEVFIKQNRQIYDSLQFTEGYVHDAVDILQKSRELAVRAANGVYTASDRENMAQNINEHIEALYSLANAQNADGQYIFGGTRTNAPPFLGLRLASNRMHKEVINNVEYVGSNDAGTVRVSDVDTVERNIAGSKMFWSGRTQIRSSFNALEYRAPSDSVITINNVDISITQGDNVYAIIDKINASVSNVQAFLDSASGGLAIQANDAQQMWISDASGQVLQDLEIIDFNKPPYNLAPNTTVSQETVFDSLIRLRDSMFNNDYTDIGGKVLGTIDKSMSSVLHNLSKIGAVTERLDIVYRRMDEKDVPNVTRQLDNQIAIDMTEAIRRMSELSLAKNAAYAVGTRVMNTSLLQYLQ